MPLRAMPWKTIRPNTAQTRAGPHRELERVWRYAPGWWGHVTAVHHTARLRFMGTALVFFANRGILAMLSCPACRRPAGAFLDTEIYNQIFKDARQQS